MQIAGRATFVYAIMIAVFGIGLWAILRFGSILEAPPDLTGDWELTADASTDGARPKKMTIEQSGRYFVFTIDGASPIDVKLIERKEISDAMPLQTQMTMREGEWTIVALGPPRGDDYQFDVKGPGMNGTLIAHRTRRVYPVDRRKHAPTTQPKAAADARG